MNSTTTIEIAGTRVSNEQMINLILSAFVVLLNMIGGVVLTFMKRNINKNNQDVANTKQEFENTKNAVNTQLDKATKDIELAKVSLDAKIDNLSSCIGLSSRSLQVRQVPLNVHEPYSDADNVSLVDERVTKDDTIVYNPHIEETEQMIDMQELMLKGKFVVGNLEFSIVQTPRKR